MKTATVNAANARQKRSATRPSLLACGRRSTLCPILAPPGRVWVHASAAAILPTFSYACAFRTPVTCATPLHARGEAEGALPRFCFAVLPALEFDGRLRAG